MESDADSWIMLDSDNPADSSDDDRCLLALPASCSNSDASDHDDGDHSMADTDEDVDVCDEEDEDVDVCDEEDEEDEEDPYEAEEEEASPRPPPSRPLAGMFHHTPSTPAPAYAAFDAVRSAKQLIPDPAFSVFPETVTVLASTRGLVCLRGDATGFYYVANPVTFTRVRLPFQNRDHRASGDPSVVITFDEPRAGDAMDHYHVVVAFQVHDGVCAFESFSSRTWDWRVGADICAPETVVPASGVGALGRAFWRTTIGYILSYTPETGRADLIPAPQEVETRNLWEIGEMEGNFCVVCMDEPVTEVAVLYFVPDHLDGVPSWAWAGQFDGGTFKNTKGATLLRSQGAAEVVMWCPRAELVLAMDFDGRATRTIGPLCGDIYYSDFIPYVNASTKIYSDEVGTMFKTNDEAVTFKVPNTSPVQAY